MIQNQDFLNEINNPVRNISVMVELYNSSTIIDCFFDWDKVKSVKLERIGEGKLFGYGVCQRLNVVLIDTEREISVTNENYIKVHFGYKKGEDTHYQYSLHYPDYYVTEVNRDETTNELSITAYDKLYEASTHTLAELDKSTNFNVYKIAWGCCNILGLQKPLLIDGDIEADSAFNRAYVFSPQKLTQNYNLVNWDGTETIREVLDDIAEATQTIYFIQNDTLYFSRLSDQENWVLVIDKDKYFDFDLKDSQMISAITSANELGDAVTASTGLTGTTVYVKNNILWDLQEDIGDLVDTALARVKNFKMDQFNFTWRGNPLLTIGDKLKIRKKDDLFATNIYYINSTLTYDGGLREEISWEYSESDLETANNPTSLGDALKQTSAKVDKVNKEIELLVSNVNDMSQMILGEEGISAKVQSLEENQVTKDDIPDTSDLEQRLKQAETKLTSEGFKISVGEYVAENGMIQEVVTLTGFSFNKDGLTISKENSEMKTYITEDGMTVSRNNKPMLTANNQGVDAVNLKASTYLIVGYNSRFEDYKNKERTGCFWIGG